MSFTQKPSIDFLKKFHGEDAIWLLTAIDHDGPEKKAAARQAGKRPPKVIETQAFQGDPDGAAAFIEKWNGEGWNIYHSVAQPKALTDKKTKKSEVLGTRHLYVDIDLEKGEDRDAGLARIRRLIAQQVESEMVPPLTGLVMSGNGYQAYWRLFEMITDQAAVESRNKHLSRMLGGDSVHNWDRIMRVPGTVNYPNAVKRGKGFEQVDAVEVGWFEDRVYPIDQFEAAVEMDDAPAEIATDAPRLKTVDDLNVPDRVKTIIVLGHDPDTPKEGDNSRSAWLIDACCQMVRAEIDDATIYSVITDPQFKISESVLDKAPNVEKYAKKQIASAHRLAAAPDWAVEMNAQYFITRDGPQEVFREAFDPVLGRKVLKKQTYGAFKDAWLTEMVQVGTDGNGNPTMKPVGESWLKSPHRRQFEDVYFLPGAEDPRFYNLWPGWAVEPAPGDGHEAFLRDHVLGIICSGNVEHYDWLIGWLANLFQNPAEVGGTAVILRGEPEVGKGFFVGQIASLLGTAFLHLSRGDQVTRNFNAQLANRLLVFLDEAIGARDFTAEGVLKTLITENTMMKEPKGQDAFEVRSFLHFIIASNKEYVVTSEMQENRRWFMVDVSSEAKDNREHFKRCALDEAGQRSLLHYLLTYDLSTWEKGRPPLTEALASQKLESLVLNHPVDALLYEMVETGVVPVAVDEKGRFQTAAFAEYVRRRFPRKAESISSVGVGMRLGKLGLLPDTDGAARKWRLPETVAEARAAFEKGVRQPIPWKRPPMADWEVFRDLP